MIILVNLLKIKSILLILLNTNIEIKKYDKKLFFFYVNGLIHLKHGSRFRYVNSASN